MNRWEVSGKLISLGETRYTPSGVEVAEALMRYEGLVSEAGIDRQLDFEVAVLGMADMAQALRQCPVETDVTMTGFIAPRSKRSRQWVLHIQTLNRKEN